eukprot:CAMPEP_0204291810 /NCGR_PEP_ID=MMETSP0468-20130131/63207_1 /ASSEMBLY_ACC=CAM_ASM_000383 /TAXON_ID=2969 /ORGANISM="Oxyrrhis marina" /LENGTH=155 /DNA_ID=CAMNT_0051270127 /DNA_START=51 /DNA_END=514 /DNA_ORIENTATION=+
MRCCLQAGSQPSRRGGLRLLPRPLRASEQYGLGKSLSPQRSTCGAMRGRSSRPVEQQPVSSRKTLELPVQIFLLFSHLTQVSLQPGHNQLVSIQLPQITRINGPTGAVRGAAMQPLLHLRLAPLRGRQCLLQLPDPVLRGLGGFLRRAQPTLQVL